jgi:hypothetical protein
MRDSVTRPHVSPSSAFSPHLNYLSLSLQRLRFCGWSGGEGRDASRTLGVTRFGRGGRRQHGQSDGHPLRVIDVLITALLMEHIGTKTALGLSFKKSIFLECTLPQRRPDEYNHGTIQITT